MKVRNILSFLAVFIAVLAAGFLLFRPSDQSQILIQDAVAAPLIGTPEALAVFLNIDNAGGPDTLIAATAPDAGTTRLSDGHTRLAIPAQDTAALAADGAFILLENVSGGIDDGRTLPISLTFEAAGTISTRVRVVAPRKQGNASAFGLFGIGDICQIGEGEPAPEISLEAIPEAAGWQIHVTSKEFEFTPELADGPHVPGTGHGHIYLNGLKLGRLYSPHQKIGKLPAGEHEIRVTLSTNDHRAYVNGSVPVSSAIRIHSD